MVEPEVAIILFIIIAVLFVVMVLSAHASMSTSSCDDAKKTCGEWSMWSAIISGLVFAAMLMVLFFTFIQGRGAKSSIMVEGDN